MNEIAWFYTLEIEGKIVEQTFVRAYTRGLAVDKVIREYVQSNPDVDSSKLTVTVGLPDFVE